MPDTTRIDLSKYRLEKAEAVLDTAKRLLDDEDYASANNRAYYSIFHGMRAVMKGERSMSTTYEFYVGRKTKEGKIEAIGPYARREDG